ncbi:MAG: hypothetical protein HQL20_01840 [Candidatus Omnitrophica bacterium]|nr:hypothetical protein [Candidatus Omnitrophota bacterium]
MKNNMLEKALAVSTLDDLSVRTVSGYQRIYFGDEFCEELFPSAGDIRSVLRWCAGKGLAVSVVTPFCSEARFDRICRAVTGMPAGVELVCNDPGLLARAGREPGRRGSLVLGRLMLRSKRDPRLGTLAASEDVRRALAVSCLDDPAFQRLLLSYGVKRVELDNSFQGYLFNLIPQLRAALHWPYVYLTATTECLFRPALRKTGCGRECRSGQLVSKIASAGVAIITSGKAEVYRNTRMPSSAQLQAWGVDRLVYAREKNIC